MKPKVYIRADGNSRIGLGHLTRCTALAHMLKEDFEIMVVSREVPDSMLTENERNGFKWRKISNETEFLDQLNVDHIVVLDGYHFDTEYQKQIKSIGAKLICIDDLHDKKFIADLIINHAPGIKPDDYQAQPYTQFALGPQYALLRPVFLEQAQKERKIEKIDTLFICFGGSDSENLTESTYRIARDFEIFKKIIVVTGPAYHYLDSMNLLVDTDARIVHYNSVNEEQMLSLMLESDLAIVPASGLLFEVLASEMIALAGYYTENQQKIYSGFRNLNAIYDAGNFNQLKTALGLIINSDTIRQKRKVINGRSNQKILYKFKTILT